MENQFLLIKVRNLLKKYIKNALFAVHERKGRKNANKQYRKNSKLKQAKMITLRWKRVASEKEGIESELSVYVLDQVADEIHRIIKLSINKKLAEASRNFRWIKSFDKSEKYILQYQFVDSLFIDLVYCSKSKLSAVGHGLFTARYLLKELPFSIYLRRTVPVNNKNRHYTIQLDMSFVKKKRCEDRWE